MLVCYNCGHKQAISTNNIRKYVFKCNVCGKTRKAKYIHKYGLQLRGVETPDIATAIIKATENDKSKNEAGLFRTAKDL